MISLICFLLTLIGSLNWFCIGVLQYDFIAGLFGSQANIFSRIIYALIGLSSIWLVYALIRGRGKIKIDAKKATDKELLNFGKKKKQNLGYSENNNSNQNPSYQNPNYIPQNNYSYPQQNYQPNQPNYNQQPYPPQYNQAPINQQYYAPPQQNTQNPQNPTEINFDNIDI